MRAYVLSLEGVPRSEILIETLVSFGIEVIIVSGTTVNKAQEHLRVAKKRYRLSASMNSYEIASAFGHHEMYRRSILNNDDYALFFEDDAIFDLEKFTFFIRNVKGFPKGIVLLGSCGGYAWNSNNENPLNTYRVIENMISGSHAYLADKETILMLFNKTKYLTNFADRFPRTRKHNLYVMYPFAAYQLKNAIPDIQRESGADTRGQKRRVISKIIYDIIDFAKFGYIGGRSMANFVDIKFFKKKVIVLPGCRD
jgi:hypothetical protein